MEMYDPANPGAGWQQEAAFTSAVGAPDVGLEGLAAAAGPDGRIYVAGGLSGPPDDSGGLPVNTVYIYTPSSNTWRMGPSLPWQLQDLAAAQFNATLGPDGKVYVLGGFALIPGRYDLHTGGVSARVVALDPRTLSWTRATSLPYGDDSAAVLTTASGQLFVLGGPSAGSLSRVDIGTVTFAAGGSIPWHPHQSVRMSDGLNATVDLADGHVDVAASDLSIPTRGPDLSLSHTWDSQRALNGDATAAGQGWNTDLSPSMGGVLTQTVSYTDSAGTRWLFPYYGSTSGGGPYSQYDIPPGQPWSLSTSPITGYSLNNILTGETLTFDAQGRLQQDTDAYGNSNTLTAGASQPTGETNSGGRSLAFTYTGNGQLADAQSPLWQSQGASQAGSQHVAYGYNPQGQLTSLTRAAGTPDALTETFGYSGTQLVTVTTPYTQSQHTWTLGYDPQGRVTSLTSPSQGQPGQAGYTPAYTTQFTYGVSQTVVVEGVGTSGALTHTYTLDAEGNAPQLTDVAGQGHVRTATFDIDHDVISGTDSLNNTTLYTYTYVGPTGNVGLLIHEQQPGISAGTIGNGLTPVSTTYAYDPVTFDRLREDKPAGGELYDTYAGHHAVATTVELVTSPSSCGSSSSVALKPAALAPNGVCQSTPLYRGSVNQYDRYGELIAATDGRGTDITYTTGQTPTTGLDPTLGPLYTSHDAYDAQGDQTAGGTPPITTTLPNGQSQVSTPVTTTTGYDADGNPITVTSANGNTSTAAYDHLGRVIQTTDPSVKLWDNTSASPTTVTRYDGDGNTVYTQDPNGAVTTSSDDPLGRLVATTNPVNGTQLITYTATRQKAAQDEQGNLTQYHYSTTGELVRVDDPVSGTVQYGYDGDGQTIAITSGPSSGPPTQLETNGYDGLGQVITDTIGGVGTMTQTTLTAYDLDGNVAEVQHPDGDVTLDHHDFADELTDVTLARLGSGPFTLQDHYDYDAAGNQVDNYDAASFEHVRAYDAADRALQELDRTYQQAGTETITTTRGFDPDGNIITQTVQELQPSPQTHSDTYTYNADDWRTAATHDGAHDRRLRRGGQPA